MSTEYTPTTGEVRAFYVAGIPPHRASVPEGNAEFDRWLAAHDRAMKVEVWDEGAKAMMYAVAEKQSVSFIAPHNPYRVIEKQPPKEGG